QHAALRRAEHDRDRQRVRRHQLAGQLAAPGAARAEDPLVVTATSKKPRSASHARKRSGHAPAGLLFVALDERHVADGPPPDIALMQQIRDAGDAESAQYPVHDTVAQYGAGGRTRV